MGKVFWSELDIALHETALDLLGPRAEIRGDRWLEGYLFALAGPIYAGTNEIQRTVIAERVLGLPGRRQPGSDRPRPATREGTDVRPGGVDSASGRLRAWRPRVRLGRACTTCSTRPTCPPPPGRGPTATWRPGSRCGGGWPASGSPRWPCRRSGAASAPARPTSWPPARNSVITRCRDRWRSRSRRCPRCSPRSARLPPDAADRCGEWLAGLATGDLIATLAMPPWLPFAADAEAAGLVLLAEADVVSVGQAGARHRSVDPARSLSVVTGRRRAGPRRGPRRWPAPSTWARWPAPRSCSARAARCSRRACATPATRAQFGQPVGAFQAVKHKLADVGDRAGVRPPAARRRRRRDRPTASPTCRAGRLRRQGRLRRRRHAGGPRRAAGARRDRVHGRARPQPVADQGPRARPGLGQPAWHRERVMAALATSPARERDAR